METTAVVVATRTDRGNQIMNKFHLGIVAFLLVGGGFDVFKSAIPIINSFKRNDIQQNSS